MVAEAELNVRGPEPLVNVFTCADRKYEDFSILFALSNLHHIPNSIVEIGLEDPDRFASENAEALARLDGMFGKDRVILRGARFRIGKRRLPPGNVRFIETPGRCDYVYISDIDIITLDPKLVEVHLAFMERRNLPYSNSVRATDRTRMTGLHFARYDAWYPLPAVDDLLARQINDEKVLRLICERKGLPVQQEEWFRPVHGIHVSPNRPPLGGERNGVNIPGWGIEPYVEPYRRFAQTPAMKELRPLLSERVRCCLDDIDWICSASAETGWPEIRQELVLKYGRAELQQVRDDCFASGHYDEASRLELAYLARHPHDALLHRKASMTFRKLGDLASAIAHQRRAVELEPMNFNARLVLARMLRRSGDLDGARLERRRAEAAQRQTLGRSRPGTA